MSATHRLRVAVSDLNSCESLTQAEPAYFVLQAATEDLKKIRKDFRAWGDTHEHPPKAQKAVQSQGHG